MTQGWIRIRSWHAVLTATRVPDRYVTFCGKRATGQLRETRPGGKSCESCLRNLEWASEG